MIQEIKLSFFFLIIIKTQYSQKLIFIYILKKLTVLLLMLENITQLISFLLRTMMETAA